jgi:hypothetical protein
MADNKSLQHTAVQPLPIGSGGNNTTTNNLNQMNTALTMMSVQSTADAKYDPPVPTPAAPSQIIQGFCSDDTTVSESMFIIGLLCIVYGIVAK